MTKGFAALIAAAGIVCMGAARQRRAQSDPRQRSPADRSGHRAHYVS